MFNMLGPMQVAKGKMVLEHLVVRKMGATADLKQSELDDILRWACAGLAACAAVPRARAGGSSMAAASC